MSDPADNRRDPSLIVLKALLQGHEIQLGRHLVKLLQHEGDLAGELQLAFRVQNDSMEEPVWFGLDWSVSTFVKECRKLERDDLFAIAGNTALTEMKWAEARKRNR